MTGYVLTPEARDDLAEILSYISEDNTDAALRVLDRFEQVFDLLADNPLIGHRREDLTSRPIRFVAVYRYVIVYLPEDTPLPIVRVLSGAQDLPGLLD